MEHLLQKRKCSIFHNIFKYIFQRHQKELLWSKKIRDISVYKISTKIVCASPYIPSIENSLGLDIGPVKQIFELKNAIIFLPNHLNICFGFSKEPFH